MARKRYPRNLERQSCWYAPLRNESLLLTDAQGLPVLQHDGSMARGVQRSAPPHRNCCEDAQQAIASAWLVWLLTWA